MANPIKIQATVSKIVAHDKSVFTVFFKTKKRVPRFKSGQFLHLALDNFNPSDGFWPESRVFSIASNPRPNELAIVYSVKGKYTTRMSEELRVDREVWLKLPYGDFIISKNTELEQDVVLIAGGTGISPYLSFLEDELNKPSGRKISLIYGLRKKEHFLFKSLIDECIKRLPDFYIRLFLESYNNDNGFQKIDIRNDIINISQIIDVGSQLVDPVYFLSGPPLMIEKFKKGLSDRDVDVNKIRIDEWE